MFIFALVFVALLVGMIILYKKYSISIKNLEKYSVIIDVEKEVLEKEKILDKLKFKIEKLQSDSNDMEENLNSMTSEQSKIKLEIDQNKKELDKLQKEVYSEKELVEDYGFESFKFEYNDSEQYKEAIKSQKDYQKDLIKNDNSFFQQ